MGNELRLGWLGIINNKRLSKAQPRHHLLENEIWLGWLEVINDKS